MLFIKNLDDIDDNDVIAFCKKYGEGIRVEYKSDFGTDVRNKLPKVISSFANSYGGILILGIKTDKGKTLEPFEGFVKPTREEIELTVENLCLSNIYPILIPSVKVVEIQDSKNVFVVIEIQESSNAPHAIENSTKMYVRTGNQSKPYDLADIDRIELLLKKRNNAEENRTRVFSKYESFKNKIHSEITNKSIPQYSVIVSPLFIQGQVSDLQTLYDESRKFEINMVNYFIADERLNRFDDGVLSYGINNDINVFLIRYCGIFGEIITNNSLSLRKSNDYKITYILFQQFIIDIANHILFAENMYKKCNYRGDVLVEVQVDKILNHNFHFSGGWRELRSLYTTQNQIVSTINANSITLKEQLSNIISNVLYKIVWAFNQQYDSIHIERVKSLVEKVLVEESLM